MSGRRSIRDFAADWWLNVLFWHTIHAPFVPPVVKPIFTWSTWATSRYIRANTLANAARILGPDSTMRDRTRMGRGVVSRFYDWVVEFGANSVRTREEVLARLESVEGEERYAAARALRRGAILATAHLGSFETAVTMLRTREPRIHILFRRDVSARLERLRAAQRRRLGVVEAALDEGLPVWFRLRDALNNDEVVLMQADRVLPGQPGVAVPFLGGHIRVPTGPVKLARITGAPLIPAFAVSLPRGRVRIVLEEPIPVEPGLPPRGTLDPALLRLAAVIERYVRAYPDQWLRLDKAWCEDQEPSAATDAAAASE